MEPNPKEQLKNFLKHLNSEEGKRFVNEWFDKRNQEEEILSSQLERFHNRISSPEQFSEFVEKVILKYESDKYKNSWYKRGIEPPHPLCWFLYYYASKYGRECTNEELNKYSNGFTDELLYCNGYYFNQMNGQGSVVLITKENS
jgi:peptide subunit release factor 1 (eRF1)